MVKQISICCQPKTNKKCIFCRLERQLQESTKNILALFANKMDDPILLNQTYTKYLYISRVFFHESKHQSFILKSQHCANNKTFQIWGGFGSAGQFFGNFVNYFE